jgi:crotonobetainyl-CoA:carnitine CoA-transferase CaiB-like acyl-CoA transferase
MCGGAQGKTAPGVHGPLTGGCAMLSAFTIVETGDEAAVRYCGRMFAAMGACVIRAEPAATDPVGLWLDAGKEYVADLGAALARLRQAAPPARVMLAGQTVAAVDAARDLLAREQIDALLVGATWFGRAGPYRDWIGDDALTLAMNGIAAAFGTADGPPTLPQGFAMQITAGATLFVGALAALWGRRNGTVPAHVELSVLEAALCFSETAPAKFERNPNAVTGKDINRYASNHPMTVYAASDGWIGVTTLTPAQWHGLAELVDQPSWTRDPELATSLGRVTRAAEIDAVLTRAFATRPADWWVTEGQRLRVPMAPVPNPQDLLDTPHWQARGSFGRLADADGDSGIIAPTVPFMIHHHGPPTSNPAPGGPVPLSGVRVADFSMGWAGPLATRLLADLGADVIKIESATHHDWWRGWEPPGSADPPPTEMSPMFNVMNRNKRGMALDLTDEPERAVAERLVAGSDIVIENYAPGVMAKLGMAPDRLMALRPGLSMVSMGAFGAHGPWSGFRAYGATVEQASGMPHINGHADWPPVLQHFALGDPVAGIFAAAAALVGLHARDRRGASWFDLGQVECLFQLGADTLIEAQAGIRTDRMGSRSPTAAPRCVVMAGDGRFVALVCASLAQWRALAGWLGRSDWCDDPELGDVAGRNRHGDAIERVIAARACDFTAAQLADALQNAGVPAAPVLGGQDLLGDPHLDASGTWTRIDRRYVGSHVIAAPIIHIDGQRPTITRAAPVLGEHSHEIAAELALRDRGIER